MSRKQEQLNAKRRADYRKLLGDPHKWLSYRDDLECLVYLTQMLDRLVCGMEDALPCSFDGDMKPYKNLMKACDAAVNAMAGDPAFRKNPETAADDYTAVAGEGEKMLGIMREVMLADNCGGPDAMVRITACAKLCVKPALLKERRRRDAAETLARHRGDFTAAEIAAWSGML